MTKEFIVFSEKPGLLAELIANATQLAESSNTLVSALVIGDQVAVDNAFARGAKKVYSFGEKSDNRLYDDYIPSFIALVKEKQPAMVVIGATRQGKAIAGRLAASLGVSAITDAKSFNQIDESLEITHLIFGGGAIRIEKANTPVMVMTQGPSVCEALPEKPGTTGEVENLEFVEPAWKTTLVERKPKPPASVNLSVAKTVVCAGRGVSKKEDLDMVFELASLLGGEVAATRPLTEGLDWLPRERYIGVSGATVKPDLYLSVGVSGQAQHTVGITESRVIVAVDKDKEAPIISQSDYYFVGDLYQFVPAMVEALKARK
jgi:electron transfer flavoprotein alpha subunit